MNKKWIAIKLARLAFVTLIFIWGILLWDNFPDEVALHFNSALKPDKHGQKLQLVPKFFYLLAAYIPIKSDISGLDENAALKEKKRSVIMSWGHSLFMCMLFVVAFVLVKNNIKIK